MPRQAVEFQPDALEIKNQRLPLAVRLCVWLPFAVIIAAIVWASIAQTDVVVSARGKVVTDQPTIVMKPLERAVIKEIPVKVGDIVEKGQPLIIFDPSINRASAERLRNERDTYQAQFNRLRAEFNRVEYAVSANASEYEKNQRAIFEQRSEYYRQQVNYYDEAVRQYDASKKTKEDNLRSYESQLRIINPLWERYRDLNERKAVSLKEYTDMTVTKLQTEASVDAVRNSIQELLHQRAATVSSKESFIQDWRNKISEDMVTAQNKLITAEKEYDQTEKLIDYTVLSADCRAVVHEIAAFSPNSAVREAEALITLIPLDGDMKIEVEVRPMDIGKVSKGSKTRIKLDAYPFQKYGTLEGTVTDISENTIPREQKSMDMESATYYRTRITVDPGSKLEKVSDSFRLIPGMEVQTEIKAGRRRIITYVLYPLIKALDETAREP